MEKRFQVFISSTFQDLQEARNAVLQSLLRMRHIPAGMELFPAIDEEQMLYIRKVIDESDYYLLIIGGRYGSLSEKGVSYTEDEYDYAVETGKPVLAFIHENPENLPAKDTERDPVLQKRLQAFCEKVKTGGRIVRFWHDVKDLRAEVAESLPQTITARPAIGWVRGNAIASAELTAEQNTLLKERDSLKAENEKLKAELGQESEIPDIAEPDTTLPEPLYRTNVVIQQKFHKPTWHELFLSIAIKFNMLRSDADGEQIRQNYGFDEGSWQIISVQFEELGLIHVNTSYSIYDGTSQWWSLTDKGQQFVRQAMVVRKPKPTAE